MHFYITAAPGDQQSALLHTQNLAHAAYHIGENSTLLRRNFQSRGGLLAVTDRNIPVISDAKALCAAILRECSRRSYSGVVLDFEQPPTPDRRAFVRHLEEIRDSLTLYLPRAYAADAPTATVLISSAISGGDFRTYLQESSRGKRPFALDIEVLRMDFPLPCPSGAGRPMSAEELNKRMPPVTFFSRELCARYFTYNEKGETHFILFDNAETLMRKARIAEELGFSAAFFLWPEITDIAVQLRWQ